MGSHGPVRSLIPLLLELPLTMQVATSEDPKHGAHMHVFAMCRDAARLEGL